MEDKARPRILCVDDEPHVLEGLKLHLRRGYQVAVAQSGQAALEILAQQAPFAIVLSDMRMPGMDGATLLSQVRQLAPDTVRMLLTGQTDIEAAIAAINDGQIFRFLTKPCSPQTLLLACEAGAEQQRLRTAERVLLEQTLHGCINALSEILALARPMAFGRAMRIRQHATQLAKALNLADRWQVEVAAMLSQVGYVTLAQETVEKLYKGQALNSQEQKVVDQLPQVAERLIGHIPRLEEVRAILRYQDHPFDSRTTATGQLRGEQVPLGARILRIAQDYDVLDSQGVPVDTALGTLRGRSGVYHPRVLETFATLLASQRDSASVLELHLKDVQIGMTFAEDIKTPNGTLMIARGYEVTPSLLERIRSFPFGLVREPVRMLVKSRTRSTEPAD